MAHSHSLYILILLLFSQCISITGKQESFLSSSSKVNRKLQNLVRKLDESTEPVTNPANFAPYTSTPTIVTVPSSNPTTPVDDSSAATPPPTTTVPGATTPPVTNPANPGNNVPETNPNNPPNQPTNAPVTQGQSWCVANSGASETALQDGLDYACGIGGADCSTIQDGGSCYNPASLQNHASYAFNSYYQKNPSPTSCDFGGAATLVNTNPSTGSCVYPSSGSAAPATPSSTTPTSDTPSSTFPTPATSSAPGTFGGPTSPSGNYGSPPSLTNQSNPDSLFPSTFGPNSSPTGNTYPSGSAALRPSFIFLVAFFFTGKLILGN